MAAALATAAGAGADNGQIRKDMKDGRLDGKYSQTELAQYLNSAMTQGYGNPVATPAPPASGVAGVQSPTASKPAGTKAAAKPTRAAAAPAAGVAGVQTPPLAQVGQTGTLPFTGVDLALLTFGGCLMLALGLAARRLGRNS